ncbi:unnamed protein product [Darwinula stevensoni]|uniref:Uncharacterized protein n=1 Tax=Darwinula stevensoni TaxID=69355 RepID=A0A7R8XE20_9CRUS|nr:unnamed protein product [Darwinula stevensoni]CAG0887352.1 unnamed protein product [Darwinula stevensoni]
MEVGKEEEPMMNGGDQEEGAPCITNAFAASPERSTIQPHFDSLQISTDGSFLLGASNLNGQRWDGSIWLWRDSQALLIPSKARAAYFNPAGISDVAFLDKGQKVLAAEDTGVIHILKADEDEDGKGYFAHLAAVEENDDAILSLSVNHQTEIVISGSADKRSETFHLQLPRNEVECYFAT